MTEQQKITINIDLKDELAEKFEAIKKAKGIRNNTDVVRNLIAEAYNKLKEDSDVKK